MPALGWPLGGGGGIRAAMWWAELSHLDPGVPQAVLNAHPLPGNTTRHKIGLPYLQSPNFLGPTLTHVETQRAICLFFLVIISRETARVSEPILFVRKRPNLVSQKGGVWAASAPQPVLAQ